MTNVVVISKILKGSAFFITLFKFIKLTLVYPNLDKTAIIFEQKNPEIV